MFLAIGFMQVLVFITRILDEIIFIGYRSKKYEPPVFIIGNPRSGTTFMHRLMSLDEERFTHTRLDETILPSITLMKMARLTSRIDKAIGGPWNWFLKGLERVMFGKWKNIHPMGFSQPEEDEGFYVYSLMTPAVMMLCPFLCSRKDLMLQDQLPNGSRRRLFAYYRNTLQRLMRAQNSNKVYLAKNVLSTGRINSILELFPDSKVIYLIRNPREAVPSFVSMFSIPWKAHSKKLLNGSDEIKDMAQIVIDYYHYFMKQQQQIDPEKLITIRYDDLVAMPKETVLEIYEHLGFKPTKKFLQKLEESTQKARKYSSKHSYSLEQFGLDEEWVRTSLKPVLEKYGFEYKRSSNAAG